MTWRLTPRDNLIVPKGSSRASGFFVSSVDMWGGKTFLCRGIAAGLREQGYRTAAVKPIATGTDPGADPRALAQACDRPELACDPLFYRASIRLDPHALSLHCGRETPDLEELASRVHSLSESADMMIVEGLGALLTPLDARNTVADFADLVGLPVLLSVPNGPSAVPQAMAAFDAAVLRGLEVAGCVLTHVTPRGGDRSPTYNQRVLEQHLPVPILCFPYCEDEDRALACAVAEVGVTDLLKLI